MRWITRLSRRNQVTIPKEMREQLGLKPFDKIQFDVVDGVARLRRIPTLDEIAGSLPPIEQTDREMTDIIHEEIARRYAEKFL